MSAPRYSANHAAADDRKAALLAKMPAAFRPKLRASQQLDLALIHIAQLDAIATGAATETNLWEWVGCVLTWFMAAKLRGRNVDEMALQLEVTLQLIQRFRRTGRVAFTGPDYQLAKVGVGLMDRMAQTVDVATGKVASTWSETVLQIFKAADDAKAIALINHRSHP